MEGVQLKEVLEIMDLGLLIKQDRSFDVQCQLIAATTAKVVRDLFRALCTTNTSVLVEPYKTIITPLVEYDSYFQPLYGKAGKITEKFYA